MEDFVVSTEAPRSVTWRLRTACSIWSLVVGSSQSSSDLLQLSCKPKSAASSSTSRRSDYILQVTTNGSVIQVEDLQFQSQLQYHWVNGQAKQQGTQRIPLLNSLRRLDYLVSAKQGGWLRVRRVYNTEQLWYGFLTVISILSHHQQLNAFLKSSFNSIWHGIVVCIETSSVNHCLAAHT